MNTRNIYRVIKDKQHPYVVVSKEYLDDDSLSWKAKGLLTYLLSKPDDWNVVVEDLMKRSVDGKQSTQNGIDELKAAGYVVKQAERDDNGKIKQWQTLVYETPYLRGDMNGSSKKEHA